MNIKCMNVRSQFVVWFKRLWSLH